MTNFHVKTCPLHSGDLVYFSGVPNSLGFISEQLFERRKHSYEKYV